MYKLIFLCCCLAALSCTNQNTNPANNLNQSSDSTSSTAATGAANDDEMEFISSCVDNAKGIYGETKAYTLCKCIFGQVQAKYPNADSAALMSHLSDTTEVSKMAQNCK